MRNPYWKNIMISNELKIRFWLQFFKVEKAFKVYTNKKNTNKFSIENRVKS